MVVRVERRFTHPLFEEDGAALEEILRPRREERVHDRRHRVDRGAPADLQAQALGPWCAREKQVVGQHRRDERSHAHEEEARRAS